MKKSTLLLFWALCCGISAAVAQDLIVRTDSTRIEARVTEVSPETVRYKRFSNPDGPTYVLPVAGIDYIRYANGETDRFRQPAAPAPAPSRIPSLLRLRHPRLPPPRRHRQHSPCSTNSSAMPWGTITISTA